MVKLGFGEDTRLKVDYAPLKTEEGETGTFTTQRMEKRDTRISLRNVSAEPLSIVVEDQIPVSEMTDLKIEPLSSNTPSVADDAGRAARIAGLGDRSESRRKAGKSASVGSRAVPTDKPLQWQSRTEVTPT